MATASASSIGQVGTASPVVGVVGTGAMGMGVVRSLARHRIATLTRDIRPEADRDAAALGARPCPSAAALASAADIVILLVVDAAQIEDALFGSDGAARALRPGAVIVVSSTVDPSYVGALEGRLDGARLVDAPVSGGPAKAADGTMTMIVSGAAASRDLCRPVFGRIAGSVFEVGDHPGQAATFKIVNNLLAAVNLAAGAEALALAQRAGIDPSAAFGIVNASSGASWIVADRTPRALAGDTAVRAATRILAKDVGIAVALGARLRSELPFAKEALRAFESAIAAGYGDDDDAALLKAALSRR